MVAIGIGWTHGFARPVFGEAAVLAGVLLVALFHQPVLQLLAPHVNLSPALLLALIALVLVLLLTMPARRLALRLKATLVGRWDPLLGVALQVATASVLAYLVLATLADAERAVRPLLASAGSISVQQVDAFAQASGGNPLLSSLAPDAQLNPDRMEAAARALTLARLEGRHPWLRFYLQGIRPALLTSRLAPVVIRYGDRIPWVGRPDLALS